MAVTAPHLASDMVKAKLQGKNSDPSGRAFVFVLVGCLIFVLVALVALLISVSGEGLEVLSTRGIEDFVMRPFSIKAEKAGVYQGIVGTVTCAAIVAVVAFPLGVASAIYLEEYAHDNWFTRLVDIVIRNLAGVPAVVYGLLGYAIFVKGPFEELTGGSSVLSAGLTLSILVLPIVVITSAEAIRAVPESLREGGYGVGPPDGRSPGRWCCPMPSAGSSPARSWAWPEPWARRPRSSWSGPRPAASRGANGATSPVTSPPFPS